MYFLNRYEMQKEKLILNVAYNILISILLVEFNLPLLPGRPMFPTFPLSPEEPGIPESPGTPCSPKFPGNPTEQINMYPLKH